MKPVRTALAAALALAAMPAFAQTYSSTVFFGDSLTDTGAFRPALVATQGPAAAIVGRFTTNPGLIWAEYLADFYGTSVNPYYGANATVQNPAGTNFAVGGARVATTSASAFGAVPSLQTQVNAYLGANGGRADANALYTVWGGANDLFAATPATANAIVAGAVAGEIGIVKQLTAAGARYIVVPTLPDLGKTPASLAQSAAVQVQSTALSVGYNNALFSGLSSAGLRVIPLDTFNLLNEVIANPAQFGLSNVSGTACNLALLGGAGSLACNPNTYVNPNAPDTYLFADGVHPSLAGHRIMGDYALSVLEAPRQVQLLLNTTATTGRARADIVSGEAMARGLDDADGLHWWANARGDFQRYGRGDLYDGAGPSLTVGVDRKSGNFVYGGFAGFGRSAFDWGQRMGEFDQSEATIGGYLGWRMGAGWVNAQLGYTQARYDLDRRVELGRGVRTHHGETDGSVVTAGVEGGWDFGSGGFRHGPVLGLLAQRIDIDGFAEDQPTLSTALAYPDQSFDSLIGKVGWQARFDGDTATPYARLTYDREFEDRPEEAFARSQTLSAAGDYAVPGVAFDDSYATLQFGVRSQLFGLNADIGASLTQAQKAGNDASLYLTVGGSF
ncbi:MAG TPA: autotransporter domain-containing protein [Lysobacter sp.]|nr:autotransporter domain-containing protein [Lysobacter sp.]